MIFLNLLNMTVYDILNHLHNLAHSLLVIKSFDVANF